MGAKSVYAIIFILERVSSVRLDHNRHRFATNQSADKCEARQAIPKPPTTPTQYNGISWPTYCFEGDADEHMFILGDWGGLDYDGKVSPAPNANRWKGRYIKRGIDNQAQQLVAEQMQLYAAKFKPRLVLNGGDNFYWGGIKQQCGLDMAQAIKKFDDPDNPSRLQLKHVFEDMYTGDLADVPWLLCLGNHDYGGFQFHSAWDQQIAYTWSTATTRWVLPALYWHQQVKYPTKKMTVDILIVDTNNQDTTDPDDDPGHNICSADHNEGHHCPSGPRNEDDCVDWFAAMWKKEVGWMHEKLCTSTADWKIIVTHFPPEDGTHQPSAGTWKHLHDQCGIDFFVGSHRHDQELHLESYPGFPYIVAGGGGGVTSEANPGDNTQYGFFDLKLEKTRLTVTSYNQKGRNTGGMQIEKSGTVTSIEGDPAEEDDYSGSWWR